MDTIDILSVSKAPRVFPTRKRVFDIALSAFVLVGLAPLFGLVALGIKLFSKGSIFFKQPRLGKEGSIFTCYKFRTMHENADELLHLLLESDPQARSEWEERQKLSVDPRVFAFGQFLRKTSLDELPQFWNVLLGELSVVGPRPYMLSQYKFLGQKKYKILSVRPGITGLWQTSGRSRIPFARRIDLDARYVDEASFWYDLRLIVKTIPALLALSDAC